MPRVKLLKPGYVKGSAKIGSTHIVSLQEAKLLETAGAAVIDETETLQAQEIEGQRAELVALAEALTAQKGENARLQSELGAKDEVVKDLTAKLSSGVGQDEVVKVLTEQIKTLESELAELKSGGATPLPESFPERDRLIAAQFTTVQSVRAASDEALDAIDGVGEATIKKIRESLAALEG